MGGGHSEGGKYLKIKNKLFNEKMTDVRQLNAKNELEQKVQ